MSGGWPGGDGPPPRADTPWRVVEAGDLAGILASLPVPAAAFDRGLRCCAANRAWRRTLGLSEGCGLGDAAPPGLMGGWEAAMRACLATATTGRTEAWLSLPDGWEARVAGSVVPWQGATESGLVLLLEVLEGPFVTLADEAHPTPAASGADEAPATLGRWEWDLVTGVATWSPEMTRLLGYEPAGVTPGYEAWEARLRPEDRELAQARLQAAIERGEVVHFDYRVVWPDGTERVLHKFATVERDAGGQPRRLVGITRDVTGQRQLARQHAERLAEANRQELERLRDGFLGAVTHELRTPLSAIIGYAELLEDGAGGPLRPLGRELILGLQANARWLEDLLNDLLDFTQLQAETLALVRQGVRLPDLAERAVASLAAFARGAGVGVEVEVAGEAGLVVDGDPERLTRVLCHLLHNAIKFSPRQGRIRVATAREGHEVRCAITDEGEGIDPAQVPHLFQRFSQLDDEASRAKGLGLGLFVSKRLVEAHGGRLGVTSTPGQGATFWVSLPGV